MLGTRPHLRADRLSTRTLAAERASFRYAGSGTTVGPFDLRVGGGEMHLCSGPSGGGKSTLARMLAGVIPHLFRGESDGRVVVDGAATASVPLWELASSIGFVSQNPAAQVLTATVRSEIVFGLENLGLGDDEVDRRTDDALERFGLAALADRNPARLSGGEQQRLAIAATFARRPDFVVLDEPLSMLDAPSARAVVDCLDELTSDGVGVVVFEHRERDFAGRRELHRHALGGPAAADEAELSAPCRSVSRFDLRVTGLGVTRCGRSILNGIDLTLASGRVYAVVGPNGAGKTTLLRALAGLQRSSGSIGTAGRQAAREIRLGMCFQNPDRQFFNPTAGQEVLYGRPGLGRETQQNLLALVGLSSYEDVSPLLLSEGEKKRLAVAVLLARGDLSGLCLDEPTLGQDGRNRALLGRIARRLAAAGHLCVAATHDLEWARTWCDEFIFLDKGTVPMRGPSPSV